MRLPDSDFDTLTKYYGSFRTFVGCTLKLIPVGENMTFKVVFAFFIDPIHSLLTQPSEFGIKVNKHVCPLPLDRTNQSCKNQQHKSQA